MIGYLFSPFSRLYILAYVHVNTAIVKEKVVIVVLRPRGQYPIINHALLDKFCFYGHSRDNSIGEQVHCS